MAVPTEKVESASEKDRDGDEGSHPIVVTAPHRPDEPCKEGSMDAGVEEGLGSISCLRAIAIVSVDVDVVLGVVGAVVRRGCGVY